MLKHTMAAIEGVDFELEGDFDIVFETSITGSMATRCAVIAITDDDILESSEFFTVTVSSVTPSIVIGDTSRSVEVQINDTDGIELVYYEHALFNLVVYSCS